MWHQQPENLSISFDDAQDGGALPMFREYLQKRLFR